MKVQKWTCILMALIMTMFSSVLFVPSSRAAEIEVILNGKGLVLPVSPIQMNGKTLVPIRAVAEAIHANVVYEDKTKSVTIQLGTNKTVITLGQKKAIFNGISMILDASVQLVDGNTVVSLSFLSDALGLNVKSGNSTNPILLDESINPVLKNLWCDRRAVPLYKWGKSKYWIRYL